MPSRTHLRGTDREEPTSRRRTGCGRFTRSTWKTGISLRIMKEHSLVSIRIPPATRIFVRQGSLEDIFIVVEILFLNTYRELTIRKGDCVADLGAHIGAFGVLAGRTAEQVVCVERDPGIFAILKENLDRSLGSRGIALQLTVSDSSFVDGQVSVDELARRLGLKFDAMKIDIEGDEAKALKGSQTTLHGLRELIMEVHSPNLLREVTTHLETAGFQVRLLEGIGVGKFRNCAGARSYRRARLSMYFRPLLLFHLANIWVLPKLLPTVVRIFLRHISGAVEQRHIYLIHAIREG